MQLPPFELYAGQVLLRPLAVEDAPALLECTGSKVGTRFLNFPRHESLEEVVGFISRCLHARQHAAVFAWAVVLRETRKVVGAVELRVVAPQADFGCVLAPSAWGRGIATEVSRVIVDWAMAQPQIFRIWATCHPDNLASVKVLGKVGLTFEARLDNWESRPQLGELAGPVLMFARLRHTVI